MSNQHFESIGTDSLTIVSGGARKSDADAQLTAMLTQITSSIKEVANTKNQGMDPMMMMMMVMMMGGGGGGGSQVVAPPPPPPVVAPNVIKVNVRGGRGWW
jgi:hypothetical protein